MPKLVLMDSGERVLIQWMFDADKNEMGHFTLKEPDHLAVFILQLQRALDDHNASYDLTELKPFPCDFCGRAGRARFCTKLCEDEAAVFPGGPPAAEDLAGQLHTEGKEAFNLDELVHEVVSGMASGINNEGLEGQITFLRSQGFSDEDIRKGAS